MFAVGVETMNSGVAVAVRNEQFTGFRVDCDVGRSVEVTSALPVARLSLNSDRDLFNALLVELSDVVSVVVNHVDVVIAVDLNAVGTGDGVVQHRANQIAFGVEDTDRVSAPVKYVDVVFGVDSYGGSIAVEGNAHRQLGPVGDGLPFETVGVGG